MTNNRTTELREKLNKLIIELDRLDITLDSPASDMTLGEYEQEREKLLDGFMQAIAATLGGENCARCAEDMGRYADSLCDPLKERIAELLRCLENDWHIHASWDGLRKFWCIELTEEGVRLRDAELGSHPTKSGRGYYTDRDDEGTHIMCDDCGGYIGTAEEISAMLGSDRHPYEQRITGDGSDWGEIMCDAYDSLMSNACESCTPEQMGRLSDYIRAELGSGTCKITATATNNLMYPDYMVKWYELSCGHSLTLKGEEPPNFCPDCGKVVKR